MASTDPIQRLEDELRDNESLRLEDAPGADPQWRHGVMAAIRVETEPEDVMATVVWRFAMGTAGLAILLVGYGLLLHGGPDVQAMASLLADPSGFWLQTWMM